MKTLITGATGLIGSHLVVELLRAGWSNVAVMLRSEGSKRRLEEILSRYGVSGVEYVMVDTNSFEQIRDAFSGRDIVFHCAAIVDIQGSQEQIVSSNVELTEYVVDSCLECGASLVHISSIAALGTASYPEQTNEQTPFTSIATAAAYSRSKFLSENIVWRGVKQGLRAVVVNPSVVLGTGGKSGAEVEMLLGVARRFSIPFYTDGIVGYVDVVDVARAMRLLAEKPEAWGERYILSGHNLSFRQIIGLVNRVVGRRLPFIRVGRGALVVASLIIPVIRKHMIKYLTSKSLYDGSKIERAVGLEYTPIEETMRRISDEANK